MGKQQRAASATDNADILTQVKTALKDESVITHIADRIATAVANTIIQRLDKLEAVLDEKNKKICDPSSRNQSHVGRVRFPLRPEMHVRGHINHSCIIAFLTSKIC